MAKVIGLGGVFFKSPDPAHLRAWYSRALGMEIDGDGCALKPGDVPPAASQVWSPAASDTGYFAPSAREFMVNLMVDDLDGALAQVRAAGADVVDDIEESSYGRYGWFIDPDGNKVELWQPPAAPA